MAKYSTTSLSMDEKTLETLKRLKKELGANTTAEVFRRALALLELSQKAEKNGGKVVIDDGDGEVQKILVGW